MLLTIPPAAWNGLLHMLRRVDSAIPVYRGILDWGRRSGLPPIPSETPMEYGCRLSQHFPQLKADIAVIIETFNVEVYGSTKINRQLLSQMLAARRNMRSPRHWPQRLKTWFAQPPQ